jgi:hypothetical protein
MMDKKSEKVNFIFENEEFRFSAKLLKLINWSTTTRMHLNKTVQSSTVCIKIIDTKQNLLISCLLIANTTRIS